MNSDDEREKPQHGLSQNTNWPSRTLLGLSPGTQKVSVHVHLRGWCWHRDTTGILVISRAGRISALHFLQQAPFRFGSACWQRLRPPPRPSKSQHSQGAWETVWLQPPGWGANYLHTHAKSFCVQSFHPLPGTCWDAASLHLHSGLESTGDAVLWRQRSVCTGWMSAFPRGRQSGKHYE